MHAKMKICFTKLKKCPQLGILLNLQDAITPRVISAPDNLLGKVTSAFTSCRPLRSLVLGHTIAAAAVSLAQLIAPCTRHCWHWEVAPGRGMSQGLVVCRAPCHVTRVGHPPNSPPCCHASTPLLSHPSRGDHISTPLPPLRFSP